MYGVMQQHPVVRRFLRLVAVADLETLHCSVSELARQLNTSTSHLQHLVKRELSVSCTTILRRRRAEVARARLIENPDKTITEVAYDCGYEPQTMCRHFRLVFGASPADLRREASVGDENDRMRPPFLTRVAVPVASEQGPA